MATKPGVGEDSVILDLPSEAGAIVETDQMLSALAPSSRDFVERVPVTPIDRNASTAVARSAKTRVAGVPVLESAGSAQPFLVPAGPPLMKRVVAFGASLSLCFIVGLPAILKVDGVVGAPPAASAAPPAPASAVAPPAHTAAVVPAQVPSQAPAAPAPSEAPAATVAQAPTPKAGPAKSTGPKGPGAPAGATASPPSVAAAPPATTAPAAPTAPPTPATTLPHGALIQ